MEDIVLQGRWMLACCLVAVGSMAPSVWAGSGLSHEGRETSNKHVTMDQVPEPARQTLLQQAGENQIRELEEKVVDGQTVYEIELRVDGKEVEVVVTPDGKLVRIKKGDEPKNSIVASLSSNRDRRRTFNVNRKNLGPVGYNPYFPLTSGLKIHLTDGHETVVFTVLDETKVVDGVETRVVEEYETKGGVLVEISRNYFAVDKVKGDVYYFGEEVDIYENGQVVSNDGAWLAGVNGAKFGLIMPGRPTVGDKFYLEMAPGAVERVEIAKIDAMLETPARQFSHVVHAKEYNELDGGTSDKWYAPGIGMVGDDGMRVVKVELTIENPEPRQDSGAERESR
jgi:hypothetical protein